MAISVKTFPKGKTNAYTLVRKEIQSGDILLCSGSGMFSKMIQKATRSVWSHVGFIMRLDTIDRIMVLESVESIGVRTVPLSHYLRNYGGTKKSYPGRLVIARHRDFAKVQAKKLHKMSQFAVDLFGYPYDKDEIIKIAARIAQSLFRFKPRELKRDREYICSEYAWECYKSIGITVNFDKRGFVAPKDFAKDRKVKIVAILK